MLFKFDFKFQFYFKINQIKSADKNNKGGHKNENTKKSEIFGAQKI